MMSNFDEKRRRQPLFFYFQNWLYSTIIELVICSFVPMGNMIDAANAKKQLFPIAIRLVCLTIRQLIANGHRHRSDHPLFGIASPALKLSEVR
ncbi:hypothetical protein IB49_09960 [Geobacillus sp. LC300]|nr:hypothetical protein IB49_09960 [Geobacillus sp. LC300]